MKRSISMLAATLALATAALAPIQASAVVYNVSTTGLVAPFTLSPSADVLTLNSGSVSTEAPSFAFQSGRYSVGDSGSLLGAFDFDITEQITINGVTKAILLSVKNIVGSVADTLTISMADSVFFAGPNVSFQVQQYVSPSLTTGASANFSLIASLTPQTVAVPEMPAEVPEPASLALMLGGVLAMGSLAVKRSKL